MRIAQVAPLIEPVPPRLYGGTERVVSYLTEELVQRGHEVTLFASGDSVTHAQLQSVLPHSIRLNPDSIDPVAYHMLQLTQVFDRRDDFDLIHCHLDFLPFPFARACSVPTVHTLHGRLDLSHWVPVLQEYPEMPLVSISNAQRRPLDGVNVRWAATVYHGMPDACFECGTGQGGYLAFFARLSREKRADLAIEVAKRVGLPLRIAGKVDAADVPYFQGEIEPLLHHPLIEFVGEISSAQRADFLGNAIALLFPIDWPEPFGLAIIEALACGTPVIARPCGSVPELVQHGKTGFVVNTVDEMCNAVGRIESLDREYCFEAAQERFSVGAMTSRYEAVYASLVKE